MDATSGRGWCTKNWQQGQAELDQTRGLQPHGLPAFSPVLACFRVEFHFPFHCCQSADGLESVPANIDTQFFAPNFWDYRPGICLVIAVMLYSSEVQWLVYSLRKLHTIEWDWLSVKVLHSSWTYDPHRPRQLPLSSAISCLVAGAYRYCRQSSSSQKCVCGILFRST